MTIHIEKLVFGGQGLGHLENGQAVFVWNALPDEIVEIDIIKKKKDYREAIATNIIHTSPYRIDAYDDHFLSTSPWQIMHYDAEQNFKKDIAIETYKKIGGNIFSTIDPDIIFPEQQYDYRNKIEFSFCDKNFERDTDEEDISFAFFNRGGRSRFPVQTSKLASPPINQTAHYILDWIQTEHIPKRSLKTLIIRSNQAGETISALFIKDELTFHTYPKLTDTMKGFQIYYSTHKSPASVPTKLLYSIGQDYLIEEISSSSTKLKYGLLSFFQVHIPIFQKALEDIADYIPENADLIDFYSGVGSIGLPLADKCKTLTLVDNNEEAIHYATENIMLNTIDHAQAHCIPAEKITDIITAEKTIILDPPRAGLHSDVIKKLLQETPRTIIYLSCNISTQARDIALLSKKYSISFSRLYNFFPRTPHIEGLTILKKH